MFKQSENPSGLAEATGSPAGIPAHVAIIMDGNGRWAKQRGLPRLEGHRRGVDNVRTLVRCCIEKKISYLTLFAFSSENWRRPKQEVNWLMNLLSRALEREVQTLHENGVRLQFIGNLTELPDSIQDKIKTATAITGDNDRLVLTIALNYGGRWDLTQACRAIVKEVQSGQLDYDDISSDTISRNLSTSWMSEPDLFIRTGGEKRMSNFLLWQLAYTELYFTNTFWPEFGRDEFEKALQSFRLRIRRFGRTDEQVQQPANLKQSA